MEGVGSFERNWHPDKKFTPKEKTVPGKKGNGQTKPIQCERNGPHKKKVKWHFYK